MNTMTCFFLNPRSIQDTFIKIYIPTFDIRKVVQIQQVYASTCLIVNMMYFVVVLSLLSLPFMFIIYYALQVFDPWLTNVGSIFT